MPGVWVSDLAWPKTNHLAPILNPSPPDNTQRQQHHPVASSPEHTGQAGRPKERAEEDGLPGTARRGPPVPASLRGVALALAPPPRGAETAAVGAGVRDVRADQGGAGAGADAPAVRRGLRAVPHRAHGGHLLLPRGPRHRRGVHRHRHRDRLPCNPSPHPLLYCHCLFTGAKS